ncbi:MAG TPA: chitobiase/beta-hexosaminidase C-terminal domain-containing protein [Methylomirabilota bacterium]|jgi:hypothetical protein
MIDPFVLLAPIFLLLVVGLLQFVGCVYHPGRASAAMPTFDPPPGTYGTSQSVTLAPDPDDSVEVIYFTTDGQDPTDPPTGSTQTYSGPITVSTTTTIKAIASGADVFRSNVATGLYTITPIAEVPGRRAKGQVDDGTAATAAFPGAVTAGNLLVVAGAEWRDNGGTTITAIQDTLNTAYTRREFVSTSDPNYRLFIAFGRAPVSGANSVTVTTAAAAYTSFGIDEFSGIQDAASLETDGGGVSGGPSTTPSAPITTGSNALILGTMTFHVLAIVPANPDLGMGYTQIAEEENNSATNGHTSFNAEFKIVTTAGTYPVSWILGTSSEWDIYRVSFRGWPI